jgi:hypothetical protein
MASKVVNRDELRQLRIELDAIEQAVLDAMALLNRIANRLARVSEALDQQ